MNDRARTIFLGSGAFAVPALSALADHPSVDLIGVVTAPTRRGSRGQATDPPVAEWAAAHDLPMVWRPARLGHPDAVLHLERAEPELLVLADYGQILPEEVLNLPRHGALNVHPSLLPRHRGASPIQAAILEGDAETGVSLMLMDTGIDSGPIIAQSRRPLVGHETAPELEADLALLAAELLTSNLDAWLARRIRPRPQPVKGVTLTRPLRREDGRLDSSVPAERLERQVRAYQPWPGSFFDTPEGRVVVWRAMPLAGGRLAEPGTLVRQTAGGLALALAEGALELAEVQPAGGRRMSGAELLRGRPNLAGATVIGPVEAATAASA